MFSLLTPLALWLAPLVAVPLLLHLMGRSRPVERDFPSLLPVRAALTRAMRRHRVRNWLQLILRTLALLCLLLAVANPLWRPGTALRPPAAAALLTHNGAWAAARGNGDDAGEAARPVALRQEALRAGLDSLTAGRLFRTSVIPDAATSARYGRPGEALARLLRRVDAEGSPAVHVYAPVFAARDLAEYAAAARGWLEARPNARLILMEHPGAGEGLRAFDTPRATVDVDGNLLTVRVATAAQSAPLWYRGGHARGGVRTTRLENDTAVLALPLPREGWIAGTLALAEEDPAHDARDARNARNELAFPSVAAAWRVPPPATLCMTGGRGATAAARATLGAPGPRTRIVSDISDASGLSDVSDLSRGDEGEPCRLLYLANPEDADAALSTLLARAAAVARTGGLLILEAGPHTDPVAWNRNLLVPLGAGRLTEPVRGDVAAAAPRHDAIARLGVRAASWGSPGLVTTRYGFHPAAGTSVLVTTADGAPLLVHRRMDNGAGALLLWLTSLSDPAWSDLALNPWAALLHQELVARAGAAGVVEHAVDADSLAFLPEGREGSAGRAGRAESADGGTAGDAPRVTDPDGRPFARGQPVPGGWLAGPFDAPGLYRIASSRADDTTGTTNAPGGVSWLAVRAGDPPRAPRAADWKAFREALGDTADARMLRLRDADAWRGLYGGVRLRLGLLLMAALLLFADGVVSLRLSPSRT